MGGRDNNVLCFCIVSRSALAGGRTTCGSCAASFGRDYDFSIFLQKSASDQLRQMCLSQFSASDELPHMINIHLVCVESVCVSQLTASDELAQMRNTHLAVTKILRICYICIERFFLMYLHM